MQNKGFEADRAVVQQPNIVGFQHKVDQTWDEVHDLSLLVHIRAVLDDLSQDIEQVLHNTP